MDRVTLAQDTALQAVLAELSVPDRFVSFPHTGSAGYVWGLVADRVILAQDTALQAVVAGLSVPDRYVLFPEGALQGLS